MSEQEKKQWRDWFMTHPEWVGVMYQFFNTHHELVGKGSPHQMFWHDVINALVPAVLSQQLRGLKATESTQRAFK